MRIHTKPFAHKPVRAIKKRFTRFDQKRGEFLDVQAIQSHLNRVLPMFKKPRDRSVLQVLGAMTKPNLHKFLLVTKGV
jgi:hypothetical protein